MNGKCSRKESSICYFSSQQCTPTFFFLRQSGCNILQRPKIHQELTTNIKYWRASEHHSNKFILNELKEKIQTPQKVSPLQARWHAAERNFTVCCIFHFCGTMQHLLAFHLRVFQGALFHTSSIPTISCKHIESKCAHIVCTTAAPTIVLETTKNPKFFLILCRELQLSAQSTTVMMA